MGGVLVIEIKNSNRREIYRRSYLKHAEKRRAAARLYRINNLEERRAAARAYDLKNKEKRRAAWRAYDRKRDPEKRRASHLRTYYRRMEKRRQGIYLSKIRSRPALCECCGGPPVGNKSLSLDHCHKTGSFRGWLCNKCNTGIGMLGDSLEGLKLAISYLEKGISV